MAIHYLFEIIRKNKFYLIVSGIFLFYFFSSFFIGLFSSNDQAIFRYPSVDLDVYNTYLDQARQGNVLFYNQYSIEDQSKVLFMPLFLIMGRIANWLDIENLTIIFWTNLVFTLIVFRLSYIIYKKIFQDKRILRFIWLFALFAGSLDLTIYQGVIFNNIINTLLINPLNSLSLILLLLFINNYLNFQQHQNIKQYGYTFLSCLLLIFFHPYDLILILFTTGFLLVLSLSNFNQFIKQLKFIIASWAGMIAGGLYYFWLVFNSLFFRNWFINNNVNFSWIEKSIFLIIYFFILFLSFWGLYLSKAEELKKEKIFIALLMSMILAFITNSYAVQKTVQFMLIPLSIYCARFVFILMTKKKMIYRIGGIIALLVLVAPSFIYLNTRLYSIAQKKGYYFLNKEMVELPDYLKHNSQSGDAILASNLWGTFLASRSSLTTFVGSNQVINYEQKESLAPWFFKNNNEDEAKQQLLNDYGIDFVIHSKFEKSLGDFQPGQKNYLAKIYANSYGSIYRVKLP